MRSRSFWIFAQARAAQIVALSALALTSCARGYLPPQTHMASGSSLHVALERATLEPNGGAVVEAYTSSVPGTRIERARLASLARKPCSDGWPASAAESEKIGRTSKAIALEPQQRVMFFFEPPAHAAASAESPLRNGSALDLELRAPSGAECLRVPLAARMPERTWKPDTSSAGLYTAVGLRVVPLLTPTADGVKPYGSAFLRVGGASQITRIWGELQAGPVAQGGYVLGGASGGADLLLASAGDWGFSGGFAYDVALVYHTSASDSFRYLLHGLRMTPAITWSPFSTSTGFAGFPTGRRNAYFEFELPVAAWFGTRGAPGLVLSSGFGLSFAVVH